MSKYDQHNSCLQMKKLGDVCDVVGGGTPSKANPSFYTGDILWATVRDMKGETIHDTEFKITQDAVKKSSTNIIPKGNVIIATRVGLGKICLLIRDAAINQDLRGIIPKNLKELSIRYLFWWLRSVSEIIIKNGTGATVQGVKLPFIKNLNIPMPPIVEQQRIVTILDKAFAAIDKAKSDAEQNLKNAKELFESYLKELFENKNDEWKIKTLNEISENLDSRRIPITKGSRKKGSIPYYGASGVVDYVEGYLFDEELLCVSEDGANLLARTYPIAFSISGKTWVNNHAHVLRFKNIFTQKFVELYFNSIKLDAFVSGMAQPKLNQGMLNKIPIPFPSVEKQQAIVHTSDLLSAEIQKLETTYKAKIDKLDELKKSILQKAFSGELTTENIGIDTQVQA